MSDYIEKLKKEVESFEKLGIEIDMLVKSIGVEIPDLPDNCQELLDKYAEITNSTQLCDPDIHDVTEYYEAEVAKEIKFISATKEFQKKLHQLDHKSIKEIKKIVQLQDFSELLGDNHISSAQLDNHIADIEIKIREIRELRESINSFHIKKIENLFAQAELLQQLKKE